MNPRHPILLPVFLAGVCALLTGVLWQLRGGSGEGADARPPTKSAAPAGARVETRALVVLRAWDTRRARAWAEGDLAALTGLYAAGSRSGAADRAMLRSYLRRGLVVSGIRTQVLAVDVRAAGDGRLVLVVTDRLATATAVGHGRRFALPRDRASRHTVELVHRRGSWVVQEVG